MYTGDVLDINKKEKLSGTGQKVRRKYRNLDNVGILCISHLAICTSELKQFRVSFDSMRLYA